jgi:hyperosmotically inducible protein
MHTLKSCLLRILLAGFLIFFVPALQATNLEEIEQDISDSVITTKIKAKFTKNHDLNPLKISVSTDNGIVTLRGYVKNKEAFVHALRIANTTAGVKSVETDRLEIKLVNSALTDAYITAKVEAAVLKAKVLDDESIPLVGINAKTVNGTVTLSGKLKSDRSITYILKRVSAIKGVKKVISWLESSAV